ncbi:MAG: sulfatase-like hydrolase/transferase [Lachnospiraceae bacterium]|nr:sulfatase-like hydrolase/transferase [Lachnospiraceae bacterium]
MNKKIKIQKREIKRAVLLVLNILIALLVLVEVFHPDTEELIKKWYLILTAAFFIIEFLGVILERFWRGERVENVLAILLCLSTACYNFAIIEVLGGVQFNLEDGKIWLVNFLIVLVLIVIMYRVISNIGIVMCITNVLFLILGIINHYYFAFRSEPFEAVNLLAAGTAMEVISGYHFDITRTMWFVLLTEIVLFYIIFSRLMRRKIKISVFPRCILEAAALWSGVWLCFNMPDLQYFEISSTSRENGYLYSFVGYCKETFSANEPNGYGEGIVEEILEVYESSETEKEKENKPDIIVIMNESFSDLPSIYEFETNEDIMPFIHSLSDNTVKGNLLVSVYGGFTVNSEYEFLTGNSMAFFKSGSLPLVQYVRNGQQSIAKALKSRGYDVIGYHPYYPQGYERYRVYPLMGLDNFYSLESGLPYNEKIRKFLSDESDYENLIYLYEKSREENNDAPIFIFNVTMQNHGGYGEAGSGFESEIMPVDADKQYPSVNEYLSLIRESDKAFEELIDYFQQVDRDVVVLMFGDHQPGIEWEAFYPMTKDVFYIENESLEIRQKKYFTDFLIWANFNIEEKDDLLISANYLRPLLLQTANCEMSSYDRFLLELMEEYPAINAFGYLDKEGKWHGLEETSEALTQYSYIQYYNAFNQSDSEVKYFE